jgi:hypothetical protein
MKTLLTALYIFLLYQVSRATDEKLYVFYPLTSRPQQVQETLQKNLDGVAVTVFGRLADFNTKIEIDPPDAILTKPALIGQLTGYSVKTNGVRKSSLNDTYVILSIDKQLNPQSVGPETVIGVIDVLGRNAMKSFITQFFPREPKLKRVTKVEDLLPLLTFSLADGILIEEIFVGYFKTTSNLTFAISPSITANSGIIALGSGSATTKTADILKRGNESINLLFKVDQWK